MAIEKRGNFISFLFNSMVYIVKPVHAVTSIKQSPVLKGRIFPVLS